MPDSFLCLDGGGEPSGRTAGHSNKEKRAAMASKQTEEDGPDENGGEVEGERGQKQALPKTAGEMEGEKRSL